MIKLNGYKLVGFHAPARAGKDTAIDFIQRNFICSALAFSDILYEEVQKAYLVAPDILRSVEAKEAKLQQMSPKSCLDDKFASLLLKLGFALDEAMSPRQVLQFWGDYRRGQDPQYLINATANKILKCPHDVVLISGVRSQDEVEFIRKNGGFLVHLQRLSAVPVNDHKIETPLPMQENDIYIENNGTLGELEAKAIQLAESLGLVRAHPGIRLSA